jgi:hypothetical protein
MMVGPMVATKVQMRARIMSVSKGHKRNIRALVKKQTHLGMGLGEK